jgi:hypothetical protein
MVTTIALVSIVGLACLVAAGASGPTSGRQRGKDLDRRMRWVEKNPQQANMGDIAALMRAHELPDAEIDLVVGKARRLGIRPFTMWVWIHQFGVHTLSVVVAADLKHEELLAHLGNGTLPDLADLEVFAALNGLPTRPVTRTRHRETVAARPAARPAPEAPAMSRTAVTARRERTVSPGLPVIHEPGSWPYGEWQLDAPLPPRTGYPTDNTISRPDQDGRAA